MPLDCLKIRRNGGWEMRTSRPNWISICMMRMWGRLIEAEFWRLWSMRALIIGSMNKMLTQDWRKKPSFLSILLPLNTTTNFLQKLWHISLEILKNYTFWQAMKKSSKKKINFWFLFIFNFATKLQSTSEMKPNKKFRDTVLKFKD
jgi:hypothetical protein